MPISCGALNNGNPDDENTEDDGEKEDQIEDGGGDGGKRGVLYIPDICYGSHGYTRVNFFWQV